MTEDFMRIEDECLAAEREPIVWADDASPFTGKQVADLLAENERFRAEIVRLTAMLHKAEAHDDWEYTGHSRFSGCVFDSAGGWERNPEAETGSGDECWRRRKV